MVSDPPSDMKILVDATRGIWLRRVKGCKLHLGSAAYDALSDTSFDVETLIGLAYGWSETTNGTTLVLLGIREEGARYSYCKQFKLILEIK